MRLLTDSFDAIQDARDHEFGLKDGTSLKCGLEFCELVLVLFDRVIDVDAGDCILDCTFP